MPICDIILSIELVGNHFRGLKRPDWDFVTRGRQDLLTRFRLEAAVTEFRVFLPNRLFFPLLRMRFGVQKSAVNCFLLPRNNIHKFTLVALKAINSLLQGRNGIVS